MPRSALRLAAALVALLGSTAHADTLFDNVEGLTFDEHGRPEPLTGLVIGTDGRVVQVLHKGDKPARVDYRVDGNGRFLLPGFVDSHAHVMALGFAALTLDLSPAKTLDEALARIAVYSAAHPDRPWLLGRGWDPVKWGAWPRAADLDRVVGDRPAWLVSADGHAGWANSAALVAAKVTATTPAPAGGRIERQGPAPSGIFHETAMDLIARAVPEPRPEDRDLALAEAQTALLRRGVTTVTDMATSMADWQAFRRAGDAGRLQLRIVGYAPDAETMSLIGGPGPSPWLYDDRLRFNGLALVLDGKAFSPGAWSKVGGGTPRLNQTQLRNLMSRAGIDRFQVSVEAHGSAAVGAALDAVGELARTYTGERRWRIEGAEETDAADLPRFGADVAAVLPATIGPAAAASQTTVRVAFGTGTPDGNGNPFAALVAASTRPDGLPRQQALAALTLAPAWAAWAEGKVGRLAPGLRADFILVDRDPLLASAADLAETNVLETWVGGRKVWAAETSPGGGAGR
ncbi:MAG TPA: amidohydrolase family protein [Novosphingobium sp.]|nr:amidohydrolase family protein [Novosphingobium sp.]